MVKLGEYKGNTVLQIMTDENDQYPMSIGLRKAQKILDNIEEIKKFVAEQSK